MKRLNWNEYFMHIAKLTGLRSKDMNTQVGAVIVNDRKRIIATGYNGMPKGDDSFPWDRDGENKKDTKYPYVIHAELNAVLNTTQNVSGSTVYVSLFPCSNCAKLLAHLEIKKIYYLDDKYHDTKDAEISRIILKKTNVKVEQMKLEKMSV